MENATNTVKLVGRLAADPEIKLISNGKKMARLSLGVQETSRKKEDAETSKTHWFNLVFWNGKTDLLTHGYRKGNKVSIEGRLVNNNYKDRNGDMRYSIDIVVTDLSRV